MEKTPEEVGKTTTPTGTNTGLEGGQVVGDRRRHLLVFTSKSSWLYRLPSEGQVVVGRSELADLCVDDGSVSRQHARLTIDGDVVTVADLGSQNGTLVNHVKIAGEVALQPDDVITIQKCTLILHETSATTVGAAAVLGLGKLRERLADEIDRAVRYERNVSLLCLRFGDGADARKLEQLVARQLRRIDSVAWSGGALYVLLAEAAVEEALPIATRLRTRLEPGSVRVGYAICPTDGFDVDALIASAHNAAVAVEPGGIGGVVQAPHRLVFGTQHVIAADPAMLRLYALIERLAPVDIPVLVMGETGAGKELAATALHANSRRSARQMISLNCAAIQETLVESELFGHEKGAFSGAVATKLGLLEAASESTLFLDEVGELSPSVQAKLLRVLEAKRMTRVGDVREREVDVRIVAATNRDLQDEVTAGRFRQDLFFRLSGATLYVPPLRERPRELPLLAAEFLASACRRVPRPPMALSEAASGALLAHSWPGNVRELKNLMQFVAAAYPAEVLTSEHIVEALTRTRTASSKRAEPAPVDERMPFRPLADELRELEIRRIREALDATAGNQTRAAGLLAMPVRTFFEKAKQHGLTPKKRRDE